MSNRNFGKLTDGVLKYSPNALTTEDAVILNPTNEQYLNAGYKRVVDSRPDTDEEHHAEPKSWQETEDEIVRVYEVKENEKVPRKFSKLKLYAVLAGMGLWDGLVEWMKAQTVNGIDVYTAFMLAQELTEDNEMFAPYLALAQQAMGVDDATLDTILSSSVLED